MRETSPRWKSFSDPCLCGIDHLFKIAPKKQGNQGCREQTMGSWRARLSWTHLGRLSLQLGTDKSGSPTHLLTFLSQAGTLSRHRSNVLQRCMTATASLRESLTLRSTIHLMIFRKEKVQTSFYLSFLLLFNSRAGAVCTANNTSCGGSIPCIGEMRACF